MNIITDERKQQLKDMLFERGATKKMIADLDIQELIFLIASMNECTDKNVGFNMDDSKELIYKSITTKLASLPEYFLIIGASTNGPFIHENYADIFTCEEFAEDAVKQYSARGIQCSVYKVSADKTGLPENIDIFTYFYYLGIKYILVDSTRYGIAVKRNEVLSKAQIKKENLFGCDIENPAMRFAVSNFYSSVNNKDALGISDERLKNLEYHMIYETANAKYLVPVKYKGEKPSDNDFEKNRHLLSMARVNIENRGDMLTVFTDKMEFDKGNTDGWDYITLDFATLCTIGGCNGIVINIMSERLSIDHKTMASIRDNAKKIAKK